MLRLICTLLFKIHGWKIDPNIPDELRGSVVVSAPHTSNWDFVYAIATFHLLKTPIRFTIKKEWMKFPINLIFKPLGAIGIDRTPKSEGQERPSTVDLMTELFIDSPDLILLVTAEGTRSRRENWRSGFYHTAVNAAVPIVLGYLNYRTKTAGMGKAVSPTGEINTDMARIMDFYKDKAAKFPEKFSLDTRYWPPVD